VVGIVVRVESLMFWWVFELLQWIVDTRRSLYPCGIISPTQGWLVADIIGAIEPTVGRNVLCL
jgi:hypothetical protein